MKTECACGESYESIGVHWNYNPNHRPELTENQHEILTGLLMGDGWVGTYDTIPNVACEMIHGAYIQYLAGQLSEITSGMRLKPPTRAGNDVFLWQSVAHPELNRYADWYGNSGRVWPDDIELTPTVLKHWYCGDGSYNEVDGTGRVTISMGNELGNEEKVGSYFEEVGLPTPNGWHTSDNPYGTSHKAVWNVRESEQLLEYMGDPLPSFGYKWGK